MMTMRVTWLLRLYPVAWRERYGDEMRYVLEQHHITLKTWLNLALGALDAHLHRDLLTGKVVPMLQRLRSSAITTFCAFVIFELAVGFLGRTTDPAPPFDAVARVHPEIGIAYRVIDDVFIIVALAVLIGGIPVVLSAFRRTVLIEKRNVFSLFALRWRDVMLLYLGSLALVVGYLIFSILTSILSHQPQPAFPPGMLPLLVVFLLVLALVPFGIALVTALIAVAVARSDISLGVLRFARIFMVIATLAMLVGLVATCYWTARLWIDDQAFFDSNAGLAGGWPMLIIIPMMLIAVALAGGACWRGLAPFPAQQPARAEAESH
jgi:hypothetical protein